MKKQNIIHLILACILSCMTCLLLPVNAIAQDSCTDVTQNPEWNNGIQALVQLIQSNNYTDAQVQAKTLSRICDQSPVLHYMQAKIAQETGNKSDALLHYQKASEYTYRFAVEPDMARKIWYARYENEHPERTAKSLEENAARNELRLKENTSDLLSQFQEDQKQRHKQMMWTGIGLSVGGVVLLGTGIGLWGYYYNKPLNNKHDHTVIGYKMSIGLMGVGSALTLTGVILAGIFGHWYKQSDQVYSFDIQPTGASFRMVF